MHEDIIGAWHQIGTVTLHNTPLLMYMIGAEAPQPMRQRILQPRSCHSFDSEISHHPLNDSSREFQVPKLATIMHPLLLVAALGSFLGNVKTIGAQTCYQPDGTEDPGDNPCRAPSSTQASACCGRSDLCLDNSLCLSQTGTINGGFWRGTCTDRTWQSVECPRYCQDGKSQRRVRIAEK